MIFAIDDRGRVFWYYPASDEERSVRIEKTTRNELPNEVRQQFAPGRLRVYGLFSRRVLEVKRVETEVARSLRAAGSVERLGRLGIEETGQQSLFLRVSLGDALDPGRSEETR